MPLHSLLPNEGLTTEFKILFFVIGDTLIYKVYVVKFTLSWYNHSITHLKIVLRYNLKRVSVSQRVLD